MGGKVGGREGAGAVWVTGDGEWECGCAECCIWL